MTGVALSVIVGLDFLAVSLGGAGAGVYAAEQNKPGEYGLASAAASGEFHSDLLNRR